MPLQRRRKRRREKYVRYATGRLLFFSHRDSDPDVQAIPDGLRSKRPKGVAIATDIDDGSKPKYDLPSPSKAGAIAVVKDEEGKPVDQTLENGGAEMGPQTGWAPKFGWPSELATEGESLLDHSTWLEGRISDKFYGGKLAGTPPAKVFFDSSTFAKTV